MQHVWIDRKHCFSQKQFFVIVVGVVYQGHKPLEYSDVIDWSGDRYGTDVLGFQSQPDIYCPSIC